MWYVGGIPVVERNHSMVTALFFFTALGFLLVGLRLFTRIVLVRNLGVDDCLMVAALVSHARPMDIRLLDISTMPHWKPH